MADKEQLIVELGIQDKGASKQLSAINKELKGLDKEYKSTSKTSKDFEKSQQGLKSKLSYLEKSYALNNAKLDAYKKKMFETTEAIKKQEKKIADLKLSGGDTAKAEEQLQRMKTTLNDTGRQARITENDMKGLENSIKETNTALKNENISSYQNKLQDLGKSCNSASETLKSAGTTANNVGNNILKFTAPLFAIGTAATKMASDFETSFAKVTTIADENEVSNDKMKKSIMDLSNQTGISSNEIANNVYDAISAGQKTGDAVNFVTNSTKLAKSGFAEAGDSLNLLTTILNSYGLEASEVTNVSDKLITTQNIGKTTVAELSQSMGKVIPTAKAFGVNLDNVTTSYAELTAKGIATSEAGTYVASMFNELGKQGTNASNQLKQISGKTFQELIGSGKSLGDILAIMDAGAKKNKKSLADMFGSAEAGKAAMIIATNSGKDFNDMLAQMKQSAGATQTAFNKMDATPAERMAKSINKSKNEMIRLGQNLLPMLDDISGMIGKVADYFGKMTTEEQQAIIKTTLFVATFGTGLKVMGGFTSGLGSLVGGIGKVSSKLGELSKAGKVAKEVEGLATASKVAGIGFAGLSSTILPIGIALATVGAGVYAYNQYQDALTASCITSREELGLVKTTLLELNGVHVQSQEELEKSGLKYKELGENVGDEFKAKFESSRESIARFNNELLNSNFDKVLTADEANSLTARVDGMVTSALNAIKARTEETQTALSKMFMVQDGKIDESEQKVLDFVNKTGETEKTEVTKLQGEINAIYKKAVDDKRSLNDEEIKSVEEKVARIAQIELEASANNQSEQLLAKNQFTEQVKRVDAETAQKMLVERKVAIEKETTDLLANYQTQLDLLAQQKQVAAEQGNTEAEANIQTQIDIKTKEKDAILEKENEKWEQAKAIIDHQQPELVGKYNQMSGEILSEVDIQKQNVLANMTSQYEGLDQITTNGWNLVKNTTTGAMEVVYTSVDENTKKVTGVWSATSGDVGGSTEKIANDVKRLGDEHSSQGSLITNAVGLISNKYVDASGQITTKSGEIVGALQNVKTGTDGVKTGIMDVNGTPLVVKTNSDGVITEINGVKTAVDNVPKEHSVVFNILSKGWSELKNAWNTIATPVGADHQDVGSYNYQGGLSTVDEKGFELASNNSVSMLGTYSGNRLANIPKGTAIRTHMQSISDMKAEVRKAVSEQGLTIEGLKYAGEQLKQLKNLAKQNEYILINGKQYNYQSIKAMQDAKQIQLEGIEISKRGLHLEEGVTIDNKFYSDRALGCMKKIDNGVEGVIIGNKFYSEQSIKAMKEQQDKVEEVNTRTKSIEEVQNIIQGVTIGRIFYDKKALDMLQTTKDGVNGIISEGKFFSEQSIKAMQAGNIKLDGEYYNKNTDKSKKLTNSFVKETQQKQAEIDYNKIGDSVADAMFKVLQGLGIEVNVTNELDGKEIYSKTTEMVINKLGRMERSNKVSKGR